MYSKEFREESLKLVIEDIVSLSKTDRRLNLIPSNEWDSLKKTI